MGHPEQTNQVTDPSTLVQGDRVHRSVALSGRGVVGAGDEPRIRLGQLVTIPRWCEALARSSETQPKF